MGRLRPPFLFDLCSMKILGILNITEDSFSDGGRFLVPDAAEAHGAAMLKAGADILDIGAASSNPDAQPVPPELEIERLNSVLPALKEKGAVISIDSFVPQVQRWALSQGVAYLNDIHGFAEPAFYPELAKSNAQLILMYAVLSRGIATRDDIPREEIFDRVASFFEGRIEALTRAGIDRERLILDPGMGFFVGSDPENSLILLRRLPELKKRFGLPLLISVSRKSFLRKLTGRQAGEAGAASLAAELFADANGADYIRTHAPGALRDGLNVLKAIGNGR
ncbi:MAG TPA: dihydropteroate synthase [Rhizomicrobium sp.]